MAIDVVIDPANGQIYWNDNQATAQSIAISGNASDEINFIGYSGAFGGTAGSAPNDPVTRVTINDSASDTLIPGSNGYELGNSTNRWAVSATTLNASGAITLSYSPATGVNTNHTLRITSAPFAEASGAVIEMGATTAFDNSTANFFNGSANGTYLAIRSASSFTGDYLNFGKQDETSTTFSVSSNGNVTVKTSNQYGFVVKDNANGNKFVVDTNNTRVGVGKPADYPLDVRHTTGNTSAVASVINIETLSSGTTVAGFGGGLLFSNKNANGGTVLSNQIEGILSEVGASYKGSISFRTNSAGTNTLNERIRVNYNSLLLYPYESAGTLELRFNALTGANYVGFKAPSTISSSLIWTLPGADGSPNQVLKTNGSGVLSWADGSATLQDLTANNGVMGHASETGNISTSTASTAVTGTSTLFTTELVAGDILYNASGLKIGVVSAITNNTSLTLVSNAEITHSGTYRSTKTYNGTSAVTFGLDVSYSPTWTAKHTYLSSATSDSALAISSTTLTSGRLIDLTINSSASLGSNTGIYISTAGANAIASAFTYGMQIFNTHTGTSAVNFGMAIYTSGAASNIPIRLGLNATYYTNVFVDSKGKFTLSPSGGTSGDSTPIIALQSTGTKTHELRFLQLAGGSGASYIGFKAPDTVTTSVTWTLPAADGTSGQVLSTNASGVLSWASVSGSVSVGGTNNGDIQYKSSTSLGGSANLNYDASNNELKVLNYNPTNSASTAALKILTGTTWAGSGSGTLIAGNAVTGFAGNLIDLQVAAASKFKVSATGAVRIADAYTLPITTPDAAGLFLYFDGTDLIWEANSSGNIVAQSSTNGNKVAYYNAAGSALDGAEGLVYETTGTNLSVLATGIGVIPLSITAFTGHTASIFKAILNATDVFVINNSGNISTGTWNASAIGVAYGGTGQTTYTNGQILIGNSTGNTLTKTTLSAGSGVDIANGAGSITIRQKRPLYLTFCAGFTPAASGVDTVVLRIPDSPADGSTSISYNVRELFIRVETASAGTSSVHVQYYTGSGAFSSTGNLMTTALSITGGSTYEASTTTFSQATLSSGNKVRLNFTALDGTHTNFFIQLLLEEN